MIKSLIFLLALLPFPARAQVAVYPGCTQPPTTFAHTWYIDPVNGKTAAAWTAAGVPLSQTASPRQGDQQHPWNSAQAVFGNGAQPLVPDYSFPLAATAPYTHAVLFGTSGGWAYADLPGKYNTDQFGPGPIMPGDEILLMSGNHGYLTISAASTEINNPDWYTFAAAPGQTPAFSTVSLVDVNKLQFLGIKIQRLAPSYNNGTELYVGDGGGGAGLQGTGALVTHDIVFSGLDVSNADTDVADTWAQIDWYNKTNQLVVFAGSQQNSKTYCVSMTHSHVHDGHFNMTVAVSQSLVDDNEVDHFADDAFDWGGSYLEFRRNFIHDPVNLTQPAPICPTGPNSQCTPGTGTPVVYAHVDDMQQYSAVHAPGQTTLIWHDNVIDSNTVIDRFDPNNPWPTVSNGINDYSGDGNLWSEHFQVTNNVMLVGGLQAILLDCVPDSPGDNTCLMAANTVADDGHGQPSAEPEVAGGSGFRMCNNVAPLIVANTPGGTTFDHNLATGEIVYTVKNADGTFAKNASFFAGSGWYGPFGRVTAPDADHTSAVIEYQHAAQATLFKSLTFNPDGTTVTGQTPDLSLLPGLATTIGIASGCSPPINILGSPRHIPPGAY